MSSELGVERPTSLSLSEARGVERRVHFNEVERPHLVTASARHSTPSTSSPRKARPDSDFKPKRKRSMSFSSPGEHRFGNKWRHKRVRVLPSKFLLGGSITDPLNLGSLDKEETAQTPTETSTAVGGGGGMSKRSAAVRVIIPPNINDPLNLDASSDNEDLHTDALQRQMRRRRRRKRKRRLSEPLEGTLAQEREEALGLELVQVGRSCSSPSRPVQVTLKPLTINTDLISPPGISESRRESCGGQPVTPTGVKPGGSGNATQRPPFKKQRHKSDNKIVSPVIPQPGGERKRHPSHLRQHYAEQPHLSQQNLKPPRSYNPKSELFQFGNYNKYYGYRNPDQTPDVRLEHLKREWFEGRDVLDIGCNIGHVALTVARDFKPKRVVGIDIDKKLVNIAQKNIKHYLRKGDAEEANFPKSMRLLYGPLKPPVQADGVRSFPHNIKFVHGNYVLESDELLETVRPEFDLVLCLSITKWIHLNWGDAGLKRFFRRIFHNLRPGGRLVLEPQAWPSYNKRRKLTKRIFDNYKSICLFPDKFNDFLLHEVGFSTSEKLVTPNHASRGFQRPIIVYTKAGGSSKSSPVGESSSTTTNTTTTTTATTSTTVVDDEVFSSEAMGDRGELKSIDQKKGEKRPRKDSEEEEESSPIKQAQKQQQHKDSYSSRHLQQPQTRVHNCGKTPLRSISCPALGQELEYVCDTSDTDELIVRVIGDKATSTPASTTPSSHTQIPSNSSITTTSITNITTTSTITLTATVSTTSTTVSVSNASTHSSDTLSPASLGREDPLPSCLPTVPPDSNCNKNTAVEVSKETNEKTEGSRNIDKAESTTDFATLSIPTSLNQHCGHEGSLNQAKRKNPGCEDKEEATKRVRLGNT